MTDRFGRSWFGLVVCAVVCGGAAWVAAGDQPLSFEELMKFRQIRGAVISNAGEWVAYAAEPDRGDGEVVVRSTATAKEYRIERGADPVISADGSLGRIVCDTDSRRAREGGREEGRGGGETNRRTVSPSSISRAVRRSASTG